MTEILESAAYAERMLAVPRPGAKKVLAFYEHRVGAICTDPKLMLIPVDDHLVHRGDGVFESLKFVNGKLYQIDAHIKRMKRSASTIFLKPPCSWERVAELMVEVARASGRQQGLVRVLLGRGAGGFGIDPLECPETSLHVIAYDLELRPEDFFEKGLTAMRSSIPAKQAYMAKIKSIDYLPNMLIKREAAQKGVDIGICYDQYDFLAEGCIENVFLVDQAGTIIVPEFTNALAGTTLMRALELIRGEIPIQFKGVREGAIYAAKEVMIAGTTCDVVSIVRYNDKPIHDVRPGPVSKKLRQLLKNDLEETGTPIS